MNSVDGKNIIITGGTSGIGKATAFLLAKNGANVFIIGRSPAKLHSVLLEAKTSKFKGSVYGSLADVGDFYALEKAFSEADSVLGQLDILVSSAGLPASSILNTSPKEWLPIIQTNLTGIMNGFRLGVERMRLNAAGHIIVIGSVCVKNLDPGADLFVSLKTGVVGLTKSLGPVLKGFGVKITTIHPGTVASGMVTETPDQKEKLIKEGIMMRPLDVASAVLYALSQPLTVGVDEIIISPFKPKKHF